MRARAAMLFASALAACVPADHALTLGSLEFTLEASHLTVEGIPPTSLVDEWSITVQRALLSFQTVTIGDPSAPDRCSYRGSAQTKDVVFDVRYGNVQTFDGIEPTACPEVGFVLGPPGANTIPGAGASGADVVMLADGSPAHAYVELTATRDTESYRMLFRFETDSTPSRFGGCRTAQKGVRVIPNERIASSIAFSADAFFRESISADAALRFAPFADADANRDHVITMAELDAWPLENALAYSDAYHLPNGSSGGSFGAFVRLQLKFAFFFDDDGSCVGDDPGTPPPTP